MAGHSIPVDFWVDPSKVSDRGERNTLLQDLLPILEPFSGKLTQVSETEVQGGHFFALFASEQMTLSVKLYANGLISTTLDYLTENPTEHRMLIDDGRNIEKQLREKFGCQIVRVLPAVKRAPVINPYFTTSDDRLLEYDADEHVFDQWTEFQHVEIYNTKSFGKMLILDDLQNLAESDLPYTYGLMCKGQESYKDKEILILGGGDGALLKEVLEEEPKFVTMIDIDDVVMKACRKYMRSVCGSCLDNYDGPNYQVIVGDAIKYMQEYAKENKQFDYVFGDLTDVPISTAPRGKLWDFIKVILDLGTLLLKTGTGKYMTHVTATQRESTRHMFEEQLANLSVGVTFTHSSSYVPSFNENWCFYQITRNAA